MKSKPKIPVIWQLSELELLRDKYPVSTPEQLASLFPNRTRSSIRSKAKVLKLRKQRTRFRFTKEQIAELKRDYATTLNKDLADRFGCTIYAIHNAGFRYGLKKNIEFLRKVAKDNFTEDHPARKHWIKKGTPPPNKGKKQKEYMSKEAIERTKATRFQKGSIPPNAVPIGYERVDKEGYIYIKVEGKRKLVLKHRYVWEQHFGPIPKGNNIQFKDGNRQNCDIENLYIISRSNQLKLENSVYARYPEDVVKLIQLKGALCRQINKITSKNEKI